MAKSSLQFIERRKVEVLGTAYESKTLEATDCGRVIVLTGARAHAITLPTAAEAGEGWNCKFVVGAVHTDRTVRDLTTIAAQGTETVTFLGKKVGGTLTTGTQAQTVDMFDTTGIKALAADQAALTKEDFTITVPASIGGDGTTLTFKFVRTANLTAGNSAAGEFEIDVQAIASDDDIAAEIIKIIQGDAVAATTRVPASGEGSTGTGITGLAAVVGGSASEVTLTADKLGANAIVVAMVGGHAPATAKIIGAADSAQVGTAGTAQTAGALRTGASLSTRTIQITEGASVGDQVELVVLNGAWQARSLRAQ